MTFRPEAMVSLDRGEQRRPLFRYVLAHADDNLILAQRVSAWISRAPDLEEDIAMANVALDLLGRARMLLDYAGRLEGRNRSEDDLAMFRSEREFTNLLLVEQPNGDFAHTMGPSLPLRRIPEGTLGESVPFCGRHPGRDRREGH